MLIGSVSELLLVYHLRLNRLSEYQSLTLYFVNATLYKRRLLYAYFQRTRSKKVRNIRNRYEIVC